MSHHDDDLTRLLSSSLTDRAQQMAGAPLTLEDVQGTAASIRRRRRATAVVASAAAVALLVPLGGLAGDLVKRAEVPRPAEPVEITQPFSVRLDQAAPGGAPPRVAWIAERVLHTVDGRELPLARDYTSIAGVGDGWFAGYPAGPSFRIDRLASDGTVAETFRTGSFEVQRPLAVSEDRTVAAWTTPGGDVAVWDTGGVRIVGSTGTRGDQVGQVAAVTGSAPCADRGCGVLVNSYDGEEPPRWFGTDGSVRPLPDSVRAIRSRSVDGLLAVIVDRLAASGMDFCQGVLDPGSRRYVWRSCENGVDTFSPGGELGAQPMYPSDGQPVGYQLLEATTGQVDATLTPRGDQSNSAAVQFVWEDRRHYLINALNDDGDWVVVRGDLRGRLARAWGPVPQRARFDFESPIVLETR